MQYRVRQRDNEIYPVVLAVKNTTPSPRWSSSEVRSRTPSLFQSQCLPDRPKAMKSHNLSFQPTLLIMVLNYNQSNIVSWIMESQLTPLSRDTIMALDCKLKAGVSHQVSQPPPNPNHHSVMYTLSFSTEIGVSSSPKHQYEELPPRRTPHLHGKVAKISSALAHNNYNPHCHATLTYSRITIICTCVPHGPNTLHLTLDPHFALL